jgi:hypothetical protein
MKLPLADRENMWMIWKKDRVAGSYSCTQCHNVTFCAGERYDLLVCWYCFFPEKEGLSPLDQRSEDNERFRAENPNQKRLVHRRPVQ